MTGRARQPQAQPRRAWIEDESEAALWARLDEDPNASPAALQAQLAPAVPRRSYRTPRDQRVALPVPGAERIDSGPAAA